MLKEAGLLQATGEDQPAIHPSTNLASPVSAEPPFTSQDPSTITRGRTPAGVQPHRLPQASWGWGGGDGGPMKGQEASSLP